MELHPIIVHFPVALVVTATILDLGRWFFDRERLLKAGFWDGSTPLLILALVGAIAAIASGLLSEPDNPSTTVHELIETHETLAFVATGLLALLCFWRVGKRGAFPTKPAYAYLLALVATAAVIGAGAYFGGQMVFEHGVGVSGI